MTAAVIGYEGTDSALYPTKFSAINLNLYSWPVVSAPIVNVVSLGSIFVAIWSYTSEFVPWFMNRMNLVIGVPPEAGATH